MFFFTFCALKSIIESVKSCLFLYTTHIAKIFIYSAACIFFLLLHHWYLYYLFLFHKKNFFFCCFYFGVRSEIKNLDILKKIVWNYLNFVSVDEKLYSWTCKLVSMFLVLVVVTVHLLYNLIDELCALFISSEPSEVTYLYFADQVYNACNKCIRSIFTFHI